MDAEQKKEVFTYTYSAAQQEELEHIRRKYLPAEEDKMVQLRRLDQMVTRKATAVSLAVGIAGALILGVGMCCCMVWMGKWFVPGIGIGLVGMAGVCTAYPLYNRALQRERKKVAPQILKLTEELSQ